jgi:RNA polymerase sigma-70 factor (ECF subfamily)
VDGRQTIETFYREHASSVQGYLVSLCRDQIWAEDLMQDTFIKATRSLPGYRGGSSKAWLFAIARTVFLDDVRRKRPTPTDTTHDEVAAGSSDVEEQDIIERVLSQMPERQRSALVLSDRVGLTSAEVGAAIGVSDGAARVLIHRSRIAFRAGYEEQNR